MPKMQSKCSEPFGEFGRGDDKRGEGKMPHVACHECCAVILCGKCNAVENLVVRVGKILGSRLGRRYVLLQERSCQ